MHPSLGLFCVRGGMGACLGAECADGSGRTVEQQRVDVVCRHSQRDHCIINCLAQFMCPVKVFIWCAGGNSEMRRAVWLVDDLGSLTLGMWFLACSLKKE